MSDVFKVIEGLLSVPNNVVELQSLSDLQYSSNANQVAQQPDQEVYVPMQSIQQPSNGVVHITGHSCESCGKLLPDSLIVNM